MFGLTSYGGYGLKSASFEKMVHMRGQVEFCHDFVGKGGLDASNMSYVVCWKYFWGQVVNGLRFGVFEVHICTYVKLGHQAILGSV